MNSTALGATAEKREKFCYAAATLPEEIPTDIDFDAKSFGNVVPITRANTDRKGFSIYNLSH